MNTRKTLNIIRSSAIAWLAGFALTSIAFNSFEGFRNHRAIAGSAAGIAVAVLVGSRELLDRREIDVLALKEWVATELSIRGADSTLSLEDKEALEKAAAVFEGDVQRLQGQAKTQLSTLNQLF